MTDTTKDVRKQEVQVSEDTAQSSGTAGYVADRTIKSELMRIAAVLVQCHYLPSDLVDDYLQKTYSAARVARMMEKAHSTSKDLAVDLRNLADRLRT
jgi:hypothetical protein